LSCWYENKRKITIAKTLKSSSKYSWEAIRTQDLCRTAAEGQEWELWSPPPFDWTSIRDNCIMPTDSGCISRYYQTLVLQSFLLTIYIFFFY
jgi:hypothetical protein